MDPKIIEQINNEVQAVLEKYNATFQITQGISIVPVEAVKSPYVEPAKES